jgi:hypothetical protein
MRMARRRSMLARKMEMIVNIIPLAFREKDGIVNVFIG